MLPHLLLLFVTVVTCNLVRTPFGVFPEECVHQVPSGSRIVSTDEKTVVSHEKMGSSWVVPECKALSQMQEKRQFPPNYDGWLAYTSYKTTYSSFDTFLGSFSVPNNPGTHQLNPPLTEQSENDPEVLYIFTGLQNVDWIPKVDPLPSAFDIIQPVLQYPADSGYDWSVKSWYVTLRYGALYTEEVPCKTGDVIFGNMTRVAGSAWFIGGNVTRTGDVAGLNVDKPILQTQPWAYTTVECYGCDDCSYLPTDTLMFFDMSLSYQNSPVTPKWQAFKTPNPVCHTTAHIASSTRVSYTFQ